MYQLKML